MRARASTGSASGRRSSSVACSFSGLAWLPASAFPSQRPHRGPFTDDDVHASLASRSRSLRQDEGEGPASSGWSGARLGARAVST